MMETVCQTWHDGLSLALYLESFNEGYYYKTFMNWLNKWFINLDSKVETIIDVSIVYINKNTYKILPMLNDTLMFNLVSIKMSEYHHRLNMLNFKQIERLKLLIKEIKYQLKNDGQDYRLTINSKRLEYEKVLKHYQEQLLENSILLNWNEEHETTGDTTVKTSFDSSQFDCEISCLTLVLYDNISELHFTQFIKIKFNNSFSISMVFMCFGGLVPFAMNSSFTESHGSSIVLAVLLAFMFVLLSLWNQSKILHDADVSDEQIENDLQLENDTNTTNNNNTNQNTGQSDICTNNKNNNYNQKEKNNYYNELSETDNIGICELFGKHIRLFCYFLNRLKHLLLQYSNNTDDVYHVDNKFIQKRSVCGLLALKHCYGVCDEYVSDCISLITRFNRNKNDKSKMICILYNCIANIIMIGDDGNGMSYGLHMYICKYHNTDNGEQLSRCVCVFSHFSHVTLLHLRFTFVVFLFFVLLLLSCRLCEWYILVQMIKTGIFGNDKKYVVESNHNDYNKDVYSSKSVLFNNDLKSSKKLLQYCVKDIKHKNDCQKLNKYINDNITIISDATESVTWNVSYVRLGALYSY